MERIKQLLRNKRITRKLLQVVGREGPALFVGLAAFAGAALFFTVMRSIGRFIPAEWWWLAIAVALFCLPKSFKKFQNSQDPYIVRFACIFREAFGALSFIPSNFASWLMNIQVPWNTQGGDDSTIDSATTNH